MEYPAYIGLFQSQVDNTPPLFITTQLVHPRKGPMHILCHTPSDSHVLMVQTPSFDFDPSRQTGPAILSAPTMSHGNEEPFYPCQPLTNDEIPWGVGAGGYKQDNVGELIHSHMALNGLKRITKLENGSDTLVQECFEVSQPTYHSLSSFGISVSATMYELYLSMQKRSQRLADIDPETIRQAIYGLLTASPNAPCIPAMANLARALRIYPCSLPTLVDDQGNPYSEHILAFVDTVLILYRSVATSPIPPESAENEDGTDEQAFGALTATSLASRILILIPHAHHHILRALWYALLYLSIAYSGSQRGVAVDYLIDRIYAQ